MFKIDLNQIVHRPKIGTNIEYCFSINLKKYIFELFLAEKPDLLYGDLLYELRLNIVDYENLIHAVILTPRLGWTH